ncbi:hypothetical protein D0Z03_001246 [Geotrichum reessii]|nr:hypothetical protein D0Z03_001246 [Galactomyces reessii]
MISSISPASLTESLRSPEPDSPSTVISISPKATDNTDSGASDSTWATETAEEILAASITEDFFWLSPRSFVSEPSSLVVNDSLSLDFQQEDDDEDYLSSSVTSITTFGEDDDNVDVKTRFNDYDDDFNTNKIIINDAAAVTNSESAMIKNFSPEPFCSFEFSPESVFDNDDNVNDPYGFLDLAINI